MNENDHFFDDYYHFVSKEYLYYIINTMKELTDIAFFYIIVINKRNTKT